MACRSRRQRVISGLLGLGLLLIGISLAGCVTMRFEKGNIGRPLPESAPTLELGKATLTDVLRLYGAPDQVGELSDGFALTYEHISYRGISLTAGISLNDTVRVSSDMTARGSLVRYDTMMFFFTKDGILKNSLLDIGNQKPLWKSYWQNQ